MQLIKYKSEYAKKLIQYVLLTKYLNDEIKRKSFKEVDLKLLIDYLKEHGYNYDPYILGSGSLLPIYSKSEDLIYTVCTNKELRNLSKWIVTNIVLRINKDNRKTVDVKLRIACDMLNNLNKNNIIDQATNIQIWSNLITNVKNLQADIDQNDLPF